jgi:hypothetical protein
MDKYAWSRFQWKNPPEIHRKILFVLHKTVNKLFVYIIFPSKMSWVAIKKVCKFQNIFVQILKFSVQISKFKVKSFIFPFQRIITSIRKLRMKFCTISNNLRPFVRLYNNPIKSFKQMKFSCAKVCKFQHFLPYHRNFHQN